jgi:hypothetical protein
MSIRRAQDERLEGTPDGLSAVSEIMDFPDAPTAITATNVGTSRAYNNGAAQTAALHSSRFKYKTMLKYTYTNKGIVNQIVR